MSFLKRTFGKLGGRLRALLGSKQTAFAKSRRPVGFQEYTGFGSNPGNARMFAHIPQKLNSKPALVVALHGCAQSAAIYDRGSGWSNLAEELGFVVVCPEQQRTNNPQGCFSWFVPGDIERDRGEVLSIRQMVDFAVRKFGADDRRVFVTGLSAGGAMASAMLATYPEVFSGGAIIAGLPYGCASTVEEAFAAMFGTRTVAGRALGDRVRAASKHRGTWPKISVWHGTADCIVKPINADDIVRQWSEVHGLPETPTYQQVVRQHLRRVWENAAGEAVIESYTISGMGHGVPIAIAGEESCGTLAPFFVPAGISSTRRIAEFWGLSKAKSTVPRPSNATRPSQNLETSQPIPAAALVANPTLESEPR